MTVKDVREMCMTSPYEGIAVVCGIADIPSHVEIWTKAYIHTHVFSNDPPSCSPIDDMERFILSKYYTLMMNDADIGRLYNIDREKVRYMRVRALKKLKQFYDEHYS